MAHELPPLPYDASALEPHINAEIMRLHHGKHHQTYVNNLNAALEQHPDLQGKGAEDLIRDLNSLPESIRTAVRNNGGGHVNHTMFWQIMKPQGGGEPGGAVAEAIRDSFGNFSDFKKVFNEAGAKHFGSGWVWLVSRGQRLEVISLPNQDSPLTDGLYPVMGNDV